MTATAPNGFCPWISRRVWTESERRVLASIHCCAGNSVLLVESFAQDGGDTAAGGFDRLIQDVGGRDAEDRFGRRVAPAEDCVLIARDDSWWEGREERFSQRFLQSDFFVQRSVFQDGRNVIAEDHERLEAPVIEGLAR